MVKEGIYFINAKATPLPAIEFVDFAAQQIRPIATLEKSWWHGLTVSPIDGRILYGKLEQRGADIMLVENFR